MPAIHPVQRPIMNGLQSELDGKIGFTSQLFEQIEHVIGHAVGARADGQANDVGVIDRRLIKRPQLFHRSVGVGGRLEISDEILDIVPPL